MLNVKGILFSCRIASVIGW